MIDIFPVAMLSFECLPKIFKILHTALMSFFCECECIRDAASDNTSGGMLVYAKQAQALTADLSDGSQRSQPRSHTFCSKKKKKCSKDLLNTVNQAHRPLQHIHNMPNARKKKAAKMEDFKVNNEIIYQENHTDIGLHL